MVIIDTTSGKVNQTPKQAAATVFERLGSELKCFRRASENTVGFDTAHYSQREEGSWGSAASHLPLPPNATGQQAVAGD